MQRGGRDPVASGLVPEQVAPGGLDAYRATVSLDLQVIKITVVADQDCGDGLGLSLASRNLGGQDHVRGRQLADGLGLAVGDSSAAQWSR
jgi:hypothetical protein